MTSSIQTKDALKSPPYHGKKRKRDGSINLRSRIEQLKPAIWDIIMHDMCPSQLSILARVSKCIQRIVFDLSVWHQISVSANLGTIKVRGRRSTYFGLVHAYSFKICELCFKGCKRTIAYESALPVFLDEHKKFIRLCLQCRQEHYTLHPERPSRDVSAVDLLRCGGYVGIEAQKARTQASREKRDEKNRPERAERRNYLRAAFVAAGMTTRMNEDDPDVGEFIRRGGPRSAWQSTGEQIISNVQARDAAFARQEALRNALGEHGLEMQSNSDIIRQHIDHDHGNLETIVGGIIEMDWLYRETNYQQLQYVSEECEEWDGYVSRRVMKQRVDTETGKTRALHEYVRRRLLSLGQWEDVSMDTDTIARPPASLWERIQTISQTIWLEEARNTFIHAGVRACQDQLFTREPSDSSITDELFTQLLDIGAITAIAPEAREPSPPIPFSMALRNLVGDKRFNHFIQSNRKYLVNTIRDIYVANILERLPYGISRFVARCKQNLSMTSALYDALECEFIRNEVAAIARQQNVHPGYLIHLLKTLHHHGHMGRHEDA